MWAKIGVKDKQSWGYWQLWKLIAIVCVNEIIGRKQKKSFFNIFLRFNNFLSLPSVNT
jgi:hypothetical protein